jgi:hypothetical protein
MKSEKEKENLHVDWACCGGGGWGHRDVDVDGAGHINGAGNGADDVDG